MNNYGVFARFYDSLCENVDYEVRSDYISDFFNAENKNEPKLLDLACGTGEFTKYFKGKGFNVTGMDLSSDMLTVAKEKVPDAEFLLGDMRSFDFGNSFDFCICCLDSLNHLTDKNDWKSCFESVYKSLSKDGVFVFDVNTVFKHNFVLADNSFIFDEEDFFLAWDNELTDENKVRIFLDFFIFNGKNYDRHSEQFDELAIPTDEISEMLKEYFIIDGIYDDLSNSAEKADSERIYFVCKRK